MKEKGGVCIEANIGDQKLVGMKGLSAFENGNEKRNEGKLLTRSMSFIFLCTSNAPRCPLNLTESKNQQFFFTDVGDFQTTLKKKN